MQCLAVVDIERGWKRKSTKHLKINRINLVDSDSKSAIMWTYQCTLAGYEENFSAVSEAEKREADYMVSEDEHVCECIYKVYLYIILNQLVLEI